MIVSAVIFLPEKAVIATEGATDNVFALIFAITLCIIFVPQALRLPIVRKYYGWTNALSSGQKAALLRENVRDYCTSSLNSNYLLKAVFYVKVYALTALFLVAFELLIPAISYLTIYVMAVTLIVCLSALIPVIYSKLHNAN